MNDKETILALGGPTKVARLLKYKLKKGGAQRVQNWMTRGIPAKVKLENPDLFMNESAIGTASRRKEDKKH